MDPNDILAAADAAGEEHARLVARQKRLAEQAAVIGEQLEALPGEIEAAAGKAAKLRVAADAIA